MQQTQLKWIAQWYQQASDYVMAFSGQWELLWQNRPCPMLQNITDFGSFFPFSPNDKTSSRTSTICHIGELYRVHCDRNLTDGTPLFLVRIDALPYTDLSMENQEWRNDMENRLAEMRSQIFGISNAVAALYCAIEEQSDACPRTLLEEQMQQLNIIKGNCCRLIRPTVLLAEQMRYCQKKDISGSPFFLDREMSNFVESCRKILGRTLRIQGESESQRSAEYFSLSALSDFADQAAIQRHNFNSHRCKKSRRLCRTHILRRIQRNRRNTLPPQSRSTALPHAPALPGGGHHPPLLPLLSGDAALGGARAAEDGGSAHSALRRNRTTVLTKRCPAVSKRRGFAL